MKNQFKSKLEKCTGVTLMLVSNEMPHVENFILKINAISTCVNEHLLFLWKYKFKIQMIENVQIYTTKSLF